MRNTKTSHTINLLIADDQPYCRQSLQLALNGRGYIKICGEAESGEHLVALTSRLSPDVIITDISMPGMDGIEATRLIKELYPHIKILALTQYKDEGLILEMNRAGADGYLLKDTEAETLEIAVSTVLGGAPYFCKSTTLKLRQMMLLGLLHPFKPLAPDFFATNEKEVLIMVCQGLKSKQIAHKMGLSYNTVTKYRQNLMQKTGMTNEVTLAMFAVLHNIYKPWENETLIKNINNQW